MISQFRPQIQAAATSTGLDWKLIEAQVTVESGGNPWAWNPEPRYQYFWDVKANRPFRKVTLLETLDKVPPTDFPTLIGDPDQEWWAQQSSWGLLQLMGAVARELGFKGKYLPQLCEPETNLQFGCTMLLRMVNWADGDLNKALSAYNGGKAGNVVPPYKNQAYASKVLSTLQLIA